MQNVTWGSWSISLKWKLHMLKWAQPPCDRMVTLAKLLSSGGWWASFLYIKGTVSDKKNIQITLKIKKNIFQSQHVSFFSKKSQYFDSKTTF